jgi:hypothetical protein
LNEDLQIDKSTLKITKGNLVIWYERIKLNFKGKHHLTWLLSFDITKSVKNGDCETMSRRKSSINVKFNYTMNIETKKFRMNINRNNHFKRWWNIVTTPNWCNVIIDRLTGSIVLQL